MAQAAIACLLLEQKQVFVPRCYAGSAPRLAELTRASKRVSRRAQQVDCLLAVLHAALVGLRGRSQGVKGCRSKGQVHCTAH